jgi:hypothetical protein
MPKAYQFVQATGAVTDAVFTVQADGTVSIDTTKAGGFIEVLPGNATVPTTVRCKGYEIVLDYTPLVEASYRLDITGWLPAKKLQTMRLMPKAYQFVQATGAVTDAVFTVQGDGVVNFDATKAGGFMEVLPGSASTSPIVRCLGYELTLDFTLLRGRGYRLDITGWYSSERTWTIRLMPTRYQLVNVAGAITNGSFGFDRFGRVDYARELDVSVGGFLAGSGTSTLQATGYVLAIDATIFRGIGLNLQPEGIALDTSSGEVATVRLLPQASIQLRLETTPAQIAEFDLSSVGSVTLLDAYPFCEIGQWDGHPLIRLTNNVVREKRPCRRPSLSS